MSSSSTINNKSREKEEDKPQKDNDNVENDLDEFWSTKEIRALKRKTRRPWGSKVLDKVRVLYPSTWWGVAQTQQLQQSWWTLHKSLLGIILPAVLLQLATSMKTSCCVQDQLPHYYAQQLWIPYLVSPWTLTMMFQALHSFFQLAGPIRSMQRGKSNALPEALDILSFGIGEGDVVRKRGYDVYYNFTTGKSVLLVPGGGVEIAAYSSPASLLKEEGYTVVVVSAEPLRWPSPTLRMNPKRIKNIMSNINGQYQKFMYNQHKQQQKQERKEAKQQEKDKKEVEKQKAKAEKQQEKERKKEEKQQLLKVKVNATKSTQTPKEAASITQAPQGQNSRRKAYYERYQKKKDRNPTTIAAIEQREPNNDSSKKKKRHDFKQEWFLVGHDLGSLAATHLVEPLQISKLVMWGVAPFTAYMKDLSNTTSVKVCIVQGSDDEVLKEYRQNDFAMRHFQSLLPKSMKEYTIKGGTHQGFADYFPWHGVPEESWLEPEEQQMQAVKLMHQCFQ